MRRLPILLSAVALASGFVLAAVPALPAGAQPQLPVVTGVANCTTPGTFTITWSMTKGTSVTVEVFGAVQSGAAEGEVTLSPSVLDADHPLATGTAKVSGDTVGTVDLTVSVLLSGDTNVDVDGSVELDGSCEAPPETLAPTTATTAHAAAAQARPRFTG